MAAIPAPKPSLAGLSKPALAEKLVAIGVEPKKAKMRAEQLWRWIYHYGVTDFAAMTNVAKELRATLGESCRLTRAGLVARKGGEEGKSVWLVGRGIGKEGE